MFFLTGSAIPYIVSIVFIWGILILNTSINLVFDKNTEDEEITGIYESAFTSASAVYSVEVVYNADNNNFKNFYLFYDSWIPENVVIRNSPPGNSKEFAEYKLLRSPPVAA